MFYVLSGERVKMVFLTGGKCQHNQRQHAFAADVEDIV